MPLVLSGYLLVLCNCINLCFKGTVIFSDVCFNVEDATYAVVPLRQQRELAILVKIHDMV